MSSPIVTNWKEVLLAGKGGKRGPSRDSILRKSSHLDPLIVTRIWQLSGTCVPLPQTLK